MKMARSIEINNGNKEEVLDYAPDFPYQAVCVELDKYIDRFVPWHWHKTVELFYMESGSIEYSIPNGKHIFPAGSGGFINSNVLHMTRPVSKTEKNVQLLHSFDPSFLAGQYGSRIEQRYITPVITAAPVEMIVLHPDTQEQAGLLKLIRESFNLSEEEYGYEMRLRAALSEIWLQMIQNAQSQMHEQGNHNSHMRDKIKLMMVYIHEHYSEGISVDEIAAAAFASERECYRAFHDCLHMTPAEYVKGYRLQMACDMLAGTQETVTRISQVCGLGSSSHFGKIFRDRMGCTPIEYRLNWQNRDI